PGGTAVTVGSDCKVFAEDRDGFTFLHTGDNQKFGQLIQTDQKCGNEGHRYDSVAFHGSLLKCIDNTAASRTDIIVAFIDGLCRGIVPAALTACAFRMLHFDSDIIIFNAVRKCVRNFDLGYDEQLFKAAVDISKVESFGLVTYTLASSDLPITFSFLATSSALNTSSRTAMKFFHFRTSASSTSASSGRYSRWTLSFSTCGVCWWISSALCTSTGARSLLS